MRIRILCVGKLKEKALGALCEEYKKRLGRFVKIEIVEVADEPAPESLSLALQEKVKKAEGKRLLQKSRPGMRIALCLEGKQPDSGQAYTGTGGPRRGVYSILHWRVVGAKR